jgi:uncharacterized protein
VQKGLTESLSGRFFLHYCPHGSFPEMKAAFGWDLDRWILMGGYPGSVPFARNEDHWKAYITDSLIETVLNKDIFQLQSISKPALFRQLVFLAATCPPGFFSGTKYLEKNIAIASTGRLKPPVMRAVSPRGESVR